MKSRRVSSDGDDMNEGAYLYFRISGNNLDIKAITKELNITAYNTHKKGEIYKSKYGEFICPEDSWQTQYEIPTEQLLENAIIEFIKPYLSKKSFITNLQKEHAVSLWLSLYPYENQMTTSLSKKMIAILHDINIEFNITATYLSDFYDGKI